MCEKGQTHARFRRTGRQVLPAGPCALRRRIQSRRHPFWEGSIPTKNTEIVGVDDRGMVFAVGPDANSSVRVSPAQPHQSGIRRVLRCAARQLSSPEPSGPPPEIDRVTPETGAGLMTRLWRRCRKGRTEARFTSCAEDSPASFSSLYPSLSTLTAQPLNWFREGKFTFWALALVRSRDPVTSPPETLKPLGSSWNSAAIILSVPESVTPGRFYKVSIHRSGPAFRGSRFRE
jgi:hypothetical protein